MAVQLVPSYTRITLSSGLVLNLWGFGREFFTCNEVVDHRAKTMTQPCILGLYYHG